MEARLDVWAEESFEDALTKRMDDMSGAWQAKANKVDGKKKAKSFAVGVTKSVERDKTKEDLYRGRQMRVRTATYNSL